MGEIVRVFLRLGLTAFGGPAAHIAMLHEEVVVRRKWVSEQHFLDMLGATNLIPGPNSTEMMLHLGYVRAGLRGLVVAGLCFITPAMLSVLGLAWLYVEYGSTPAADWLLFGVKPVVIVIILGALWGLGRKALRSGWMLALGAAVMALYFLGGNEIALMLGAGLLVVLVRRGVGVLKGLALPGLAGWMGWAGASAPFGLGALFLVFLKVGAVLYGSGYVLIAFLQADLVERLGWLTQQQLIDAVAAGQLTPGPVFTTATFVGYLLGGLPGALVATVGIFLPSFFLVLASNPIIPRLRESKFAGAFLDGVNAGALGLMAAVTWQLGGAAVVDLPSAGLLLAAGLLLFRFRVNSAWLVLGGAAAGYVLSAFA